MEVASQSLSFGHRPACLTDIRDVQICHYAETFSCSKRPFTAAQIVLQQRGDESPKVIATALQDYVLLVHSQGLGLYGLHHICRARTCAMTRPIDFLTNDMWEYQMIGLLLVPSKRTVCHLVLLSCSE